MSKFRKALERFVMALQSNGDNIMVSGSGLVHVPQRRLNEIPKVIQEHHDQEARRAR
jgi:RNase P/RNase MRP subunit p29